MINGVLSGEKKAVVKQIEELSGNGIHLIAANTDEENGQKKALRVASYCRVSTDEEKQLGSFENQIEYFTRLINENSKYELARVYHDEAFPVQQPEGEAASWK